jgi:RIO kinase 1
MISDITAVVKGGKEANVYRCTGAAASLQGSVAAKVYRPRMFRNLRNDALYRQGRETLTAGGTPVKENDHRTMRALGKKTGFGQQVAHTSWLMHEYKTLESLHAAGAAVPRPFGASDNAILMGFVGDEQVAAPALSEVSLSPALARELFDEAIRNIELLLQLGLVHGDLSAYNVLYWEEEITLIDFPQVMRVRSNTGQINNNAHKVLQRDVRRICQYFQRQGLRANSESIAADLWQRHVHEIEEFMLADLSRFESEDDDAATLVS